jgi:ribosomal protein S18 acetylase RimI-like enzyme
MKETYIRRAVSSDLPYFYEICLKTGDEGKDASPLFNDPYLIGQYFAAPYVLYPKGICFIVEFDYRPQGYIVGVPDTENFNRWMEEEWLPPLRKRYSLPFEPEPARSEKEKGIVNSLHACHFPNKNNIHPGLENYPAHLHIDLLPCIQGKGWGRSLMNCLCGELARLGVQGVHLGVGRKNSGAINFYHKMDFSVLREAEWGYIMGKLCATGA